MRPALFSLAAAASLFAVGTSEQTPASDPVIRPAVVTMPNMIDTSAACRCMSGGVCTCGQNCQCAPPVGEIAHAVITPVAVRTTAAPRGYICGPNGCYPAAAASGQPAMVSRGNYGERRGMFGRWYPGRRVVGMFRRRR